MARDTSRVSVQGDILLKAKLQLDGVTGQLGQLTKKMGEMKLSDKATKNFTGSFERINELLPNLQKQMAKGFFDEGEMSDYLADTKRLTTELNKISRAMRSMPTSAITVDSPKLRELTQEIESLRNKMATTKKDFKLDASGFPNATKEVATLMKQLTSAANAGKNVTATFQSYKQSMADLTAILEGNVVAADNEVKATDAVIVSLQARLKLYKDTKAELDSQARGHTPGAVAGLKAIGEDDPAVLEATKRAHGNVKKSAELDAPIERIKEQITEATNRQTQANELYEASLAKVNVQLIKSTEIEGFGAKNEAAMQQFDTDLADIAKSLTDTAEDADKLKKRMTDFAQIKLDRQAQGLETYVTALRTGITAAEDHVKAQKEEEAQTEKTVGAFKSKIAQMFGLYNVYQMIRRGIRQAYASIKELDSAMNAIAVVTNMTTDSLWGQIEAYMAVAQQYGVATKGVFEVSKLYYQQGRASAEVTLLTAETLKMAKIAGLDYSKATDNMTVALNGFKIAANEANEIVDVYAQLAATSAVSTEELAYAMSKTASIAASAGMSFQNTSVFLAQMIQTTREAPENIGTALKTIIARFSEMKKSPLELVNVEGEELSFNRVDKALQTVGVSLKDASGQFADLDGIIYELADKWDTLDRNTQRYIATTVAGSRQQSRFLALMQDAKGLRELQVEAANSEDAGLIQYAKTLDSVETKLNQLSTSFQQLYMGIFNGPFIKGFLDAFKTVIDLLKEMPGIVTVFVIPAILMAVKTFLSIVVTSTIKTYKGMNTKIVSEAITRIKIIEAAELKSLAAIALATKAAKSGDVNLARKLAQKSAKTATEAALDPEVVATGLTGMFKSGGKGYAALTKFGVFLGKTVVPFLVQAAGVALVAAATIGILELGRKAFAPTSQERVTTYEKNIETTNIKRASAKAEMRDLVTLKRKYDDLKGSQNLNNASRQEWLDLNNEIAEKYPELFERFDEEGNAVVDLGDRYKDLARDKNEAYSKANLENIKATVTALGDSAYTLQGANKSGLKVGSTFGDLATKGLFGLLSLGQRVISGETGNITGMSATEQLKTSSMMDNITGKSRGMKESDDFLEMAIKELNWGGELQTYKDAAKDYNLSKELTEGKDAVGQLVWNFIKEGYNNWDENLKEIDRYIIANFGSILADWEFTQDAAIDSPIIKAQLDSKLAGFWKFLKGTSDNIQDAALRMIEEAPAFLDQQQANITTGGLDYRATGANKDNVKLAEKAVAGSMSRNELEALKGTKAGDLIADLLPTYIKETDDQIALVAKGYIDVLKKENLISESEIDSATAEITEILQGYSGEMLDVYNTNLRDILSLDRTLEDGPVKAGKSQLDLKKGHDEVMAQIAKVEGEAGDKLRALLPSLDPTSLLGWYDLAYQASNIDGMSSDVIQAIKDYGDYFRLTDQQQIEVLAKYREAMEVYSDIMSKPLDQWQVDGWIQDDVLDITDLSADGQTLLESGQIKLLAHILGGTSEVIDLLTEGGLIRRTQIDGDFAKRTRQKQIDLAKALVDGIDLETGKIKLSEDNYRKLIQERPDLANLFQFDDLDWIFIGQKEGWANLINIIGENSIQISEYAENKILDEYQKIFKIFESGEAPGEDDIVGWIKTGKLDASFFNETLTDFGSEALRTLAEEILLTELDSLEGVIDPKVLAVLKTASAARAAKIAAKTQEDFISALVGSIDFKTGKININEELYQKIVSIVPSFDKHFDKVFGGYESKSLSTFTALIQMEAEGIEGAGQLLIESFEVVGESIRAIFDSPEKLIESATS